MGVSSPPHEPEVVCVATWTVGTWALQGVWPGRGESQGIRQAGRQAGVCSQGRELPTLEALDRLFLKQNFETGEFLLTPVLGFSYCLRAVTCGKTKGLAAWPLCPGASRMAHHLELAMPALLQKGRFESFLQGRFFLPSPPRTLRISFLCFWLPDPLLLS